MKFFDSTLNFILIITLLCLIGKINTVKLKWGIFSAGRIAHDFILSLNNFSKEDHEVVAIASKNETKVNHYATKFKISAAYTNYTEMAKDPNVNVVYVATINPLHFPAVKLMLENKKHVLCEKPMVVHPEDARELFRIAKENKVVLMEALWSRFLPAYVQATEMINNGTIGEIEHVNSHQLLSGGWRKRISNLNLGGGTALDIGIYGLHAILTAVNFSKPTEFKVVGKKLSENSSDMTVAIVMKFKNDVTASLVMSSFVDQSVNERLSHVAYMGSKGFIYLPYPMNGPDYFEVNGQRVDAKITDNQDGYIWPTTAGLRFSAIEMKKVIDENRLTSDKMPPELTYLFADLVKEMHNQMNITYPPTIKTYDFKKIE